MTNPSSERRSVVVEREVPFPPERIWRALTQPHLIEEWLMTNDFKPVVDHRFNLRGDWGAVDCQVLALEPNKSLSYTWAALGLESVVRWTLTPTSTGTHLRINRASGRIRAKPTSAPNSAGRSSSRSWSRCWRGMAEFDRKSVHQAEERA
ncbi:MAG: SRPBCC family protein [Bradyrhizobium sp.]